MMSEKLIACAIGVVLVTLKAPVSLGPRSDGTAVEVATSIKLLLASRIFTDTRTLLAVTLPVLMTWPSLMPTCYANWRPNIV